jgi:hypothetical protein
VKQHWVYASEELPNAGAVHARLRAMAEADIGRQARNGESMRRTLAWLDSEMLRQRLSREAAP